jgi:glutathione synthase/RimK-type ligase-like ATP-grasp enzyme
MFGENDDDPIVCEVNARAVFSAMEEINEMDIKGLYVDYILEQVGGAQ